MIKQTNTKTKKNIISASTHYKSSNKKQFTPARLIKAWNTARGGDPTPRPHCTPRGWGQPPRHTFLHACAVCRSYCLPSKKDLVLIQRLSFEKVNLCVLGMCVCVFLLIIMVTSIGRNLETSISLILLVRCNADKLLVLTLRSNYNVNLLTLDST